MQPDNDKTEARLGVCQLSKIFYHCLKGCLNRTVPHTGLQFDLKFSFLSVHHIRESLLGFASQLVDGEVLFNTLLYLAMGGASPPDRSEEKRLKENLSVLMNLVICRNFPEFRFGPDCEVELVNDPVPTHFTEELFLDESYQPSELELKILRGVPLVRVRVSTPDINIVRLNISPPPEEKPFSGRISRQSSAGNFFSDTKRSDLQTTNRLAYYSNITDPEHQASVSKEYDIATRYFSGHPANPPAKDFLAETSSAVKLTKKEQEIYHANPLAEKKFDLGSILSGNKPLQSRVFQGLDTLEFKKMIKTKVDQLDHNRAMKRLEHLGKEHKSSTSNFLAHERSSGEKKQAPVTRDAQTKPKPQAGSGAVARPDYKPKSELSQLLGSISAKKKSDLSFKSKYFNK